MPKKPKANQKGFTLLEILIAVAISGLVVAAAASALFQVFQSTDTAAHMVAVRHVQTAGCRVSTDALQAQTVSANIATAWGSEGFPLELHCEDWQGNSDNITYTLDVPSGELKRKSLATSTPMIVARYLTGDTTCSWNETAKVLTLTVTASVTGAHGPETETRTYEIEPRPLS